MIRWLSCSFEKIKSIYFLNWIQCALVLCIAPSSLFCASSEDHRARKTTCLLKGPLVLLYIHVKQLLLHVNSYHGYITNYSANLSLFPSKHIESFTHKKEKKSTVFNFKLTNCWWCHVVPPLVKTNVVVLGKHWIKTL